MKLLTAIAKRIVIQVQLRCSFANHVHILLVPPVFVRLSSVFGRLENSVPFWICLPKTVGLGGLPNLLLPDLEDLADFARIPFLMCFLSVSLA